MSGRWVVKVRRYGGGHSVVAWRVTEEDARRIAARMNEEYQTDAYYVEEWDEERFKWPS